MVVNFNAIDLSTLTVDLLESHGEHESVHYRLDKEQAKK